MCGSIQTQHVAPFIGSEELATIPADELSSENYFQAAKMLEPLCRLRQH
jgi:hypothetical protein